MIHNHSISRLQRVQIRDVWQSEPQGFTPWLSSEDNLPFLGDSIGMQLEWVATEESVGDFRADIVCRSQPDGGLVIIENQFSSTDHTHLGQILTYAAGLDATTVVWVAERIRDEHRAAIDWLNKHTPEHVNFFALEIELWRIADSPVAPKFNVVCKPNEWTRRVAVTARPTSEMSQFRWAYWSEFVKQPLLATIANRTLTPNRQGNLPIPTAWKDFVLQVYASSSGGECAVYVSCRSDRRFENFAKLKVHENEIAEEVGQSIRWQTNEAQNAAWIIMTVEGLHPSNTDDWPRQHAILAERTVEFFKAFDPFIRELESIGRN